MPNVILLVAINLFSRLERGGRRISPAIRVLFAALLVTGPIRVAARSPEIQTGGVTSWTRPNAASGPTEVSVRIWVIDIDAINSNAQSYSASIFLGLRWRDPRLAHNIEGNVRYQLNQIWHPGILIANETGVVPRAFPEVAEVDPVGTVFYRQRYIGSFSQPLILKDFPFDDHSFSFYFAAPGKSPQDLIFVPDTLWMNAGIEDAAGIADNISLPDWTIVHTETKPSPYKVAPGVEVAGYQFDFHAVRLSRYYVMKVIIPLVLIVMMSWSVFWIDPENAGTQMGVATTSMLTLIAYRFAVDAHVPKVVYMTRMDEFIVASTLIVFLALIQVIVTSNLARNQRHELAIKIDRFSRVIFPLFFVTALIVSLLT